MSLWEYPCFNFGRLRLSNFIFVSVLKLSIGFFSKFFCKYIGNWDAANIVIDSIRGRDLEVLNHLGYSASFKNVFVMKIVIQTSAKPLATPNKNPSDRLMALTLALPSFF